MTIHLDPDASMDDILLELAEKFEKSRKFWGRISMILTLEGKKLSVREESEIVNTISGHSEVDILCLYDSDTENNSRNDLIFRRKYMELNQLTGQFHSGSVKKGEIISVEPSIVIIGDVYEGACVESSGNVIVLGELSGTVKAGCCGNTDAVAVGFLMTTDDVSINGISLSSSGIRFKKSNHPTAVMIQNGELCVKEIKKDFFDALRHKKCW